MRRFLTAVSLSLFFALPARADIIVVAPDIPLSPGSQAKVQVLFTNAGDTPEEVVVPETLGYALTGDGTPIDGTLSIADPGNAGRATLTPGMFLQHAYLFEVPRRWTGIGRLAVTLPKANVAMIDISEPTVQLVEATSLEDTDASEEDTGEEDTGVIEAIEEAVDEVYQPDEDKAFGLHEPMYFLYGLNPDEAKFQISFKYRLFHNIKDTSALRWLQNLNVGYTQLSFWDFDSASKPFRDSSYKPELFYDIGNPIDPDSLIIPGLGLRHVRVGFLHESNGQDGLASRSLNYAYIQPEFVFDFNRPAERCSECEWWELSVKPKAWHYVGSTSDNPTIDDFRGHAEIAVRIMQRNERQQSGPGLMASLRKGDAQDKATLQIDATTPFPFVQKLFTPNLHVQFLSGYSESLIGFDQKDTRLRVGFGTRW